SRCGGPGGAYVVGGASGGGLATLMLLAGASLAVWGGIVGCGLLPASGGICSRRFVPSLRAWAPWWALALLLGFLVVLGVDSFFQPLWAYDAWAQWTPKAKSIVLFGGLDKRYFELSAPNSDYPLLVPAVEAVDFRFMGDFGTQVLHLQFFFLVA